MKPFSSLFLLLFLSTFMTQGQGLTLNDLQKISSVGNWQSANQALVNKGWEYYESSKGDTHQYNTITWSYNRSFGDKAEGWFYVYTFDEKPSKVVYNTFNKPAFKKIQSSLGALGYRLQDSQIGDNEITSTYINPNYILDIVTEKREGSSTFDETITGYRFILIKKEGVFDSDNGKKIEYHENGNINIVYNLKNGKIHGAIKVFHPNGELKKTGMYKNGEPNGFFEEYDENGVKMIDYNMKGGLKNGMYTEYENGKKLFTSNYVNDVLSGKHIGYVYNEDGNLIFEQYGQHKNGERQGPWEIKEIGGNSNTIYLTTYNQGVKDGAFLHPKGDSLVTGYYSKDKLNGKYKVYLDPKRVLVGGLINTDTTKLQTLIEGYYVNGNKSGNWKYFDITKTLRQEGRYENDEKQGSWKYYYTSYFIENEPAPYSKKLHLIENYNNGELNGETKRFSTLSREDKPCPENSEKSEGCWEFVYEIITETANYKDGELHGDYSYKTKNSDYIIEGQFENGKKYGEWIQTTQYLVDSKPVYITEVGMYENGEKNGTWKEYVENSLWKEINYRHGIIHGDYTKHSNGIITERKNYKNAKLKQLIMYDSTGIKPIDKLDYIQNSKDGSLWKRTFPINNLTITQEYKVLELKELNDLNFKFIFRNKSNPNSHAYNSYKDGKFEILKNNIPHVVGNYFKDTPRGKWTHYYYDQKVKMVVNYINGEEHSETYLTLNDEPFDGTFVYTDSEDNIREERRIRDGLRDGKTEFIDLSTNETIKKVKYKDGVLK